MSRSCGACSACCTAIGVTELQKGPGDPCTALVQIGERKPGQGGCSIYKFRPPTCKSFECLWLKGVFSGSDRPDRSGLVFHVPDELEQKNLDMIMATEVWAGASTEPKGKELVIRASRVTKVVVGPFGEAKVNAYFKESPKRVGTKIIVEKLKAV